ncbi:hypothetical protein MF4836_25945 [Pseudomonas sp. MF4836]|nr:hypothetical protein MF4836_25945 [Pseudomonas sp. MF4836]
MLSGDHSVAGYMDGCPVLRKGRRDGSYSGAQFLLLAHVLLGTAVSLRDMQLHQLPPVGRNFGPQHRPRSIVTSGENELGKLAWPSRSGDFGESGSGMHGANLPLGERCQLRVWG